MFFHQFSRINRTSHNLFLQLKQKDNASQVAAKLQQQLQRNQQQIQNINQQNRALKLQQKRLQPQPQPQPSQMIMVPVPINPMMVSGMQGLPGIQQPFFMNGAQLGMQFNAGSVLANNNQRFQQPLRNQNPANQLGNRGKQPNKQSNQQSNQNRKKKGSQKKNGK
jgi:hypothetical protein